jgi:hypothetical protein
VRRKRVARHPRISWRYGEERSDALPTAGDIVRQFRSGAPHLSDDEVIFALQNLVARGIMVAQRST